jgi:hypothetical protein
MRRNVLLLGIALLVLQGCDCFTRVVYVAEKQPVIKTVPRPKLVAGDDQANLKVLMEYSRALEAAIKEYNQQVQQHNVANGYPETNP